MKVKSIFSQDIPLSEYALWCKKNVKMQSSVRIGHPSASHRVQLSPGGRFASSSRAHVELVLYIKDERERWWHREWTYKSSLTHSPLAETHTFWSSSGRAGDQPTNSFTYNIHPEEIKLWVCGGAAALTDCVLRSEVRPTCQGLRWVRDAIDISSRAPATAKCSVTHFN